MSRVLPINCINDANIFLFLYLRRFTTTGPTLSPVALLCSPWLPSQYGH